jgi:hypothetical protein
VYWWIFVFCVVILCILEVFTNASEDCITSIFGVDHNRRFYHYENLKSNILHHAVIVR